MLHDRKGTSLIEWIVVAIVVIGVLGGVILAIAQAAQAKLITIQGAM
jgi:hypothetical protein